MKHGNKTFMCFCHAKVGKHGNEAIGGKSAINYSFTMTIKFYSVYFVKNRIFTIEINTTGTYLQIKCLFLS
jgi:hypothetical protein